MMREDLQRELKKLNVEFDVFSMPNDEFHMVETVYCNMDYDEMSHAEIAYLFSKIGVKGIKEIYPKIKNASAYYFKHNQAMLNLMIEKFRAIDKIDDKYAKLQFKSQFNLINKMASDDGSIALKDWNESITKNGIHF